MEWETATPPGTIPFNAPAETLAQPGSLAPGSPCGADADCKGTNVRCATINDFRELAEECGLEVLECVALAEGRIVSVMPNLRGDLAVFRLRKKEVH